MRVLVAVDDITTRNVKDFGKSTVTVFDPQELIATVKAIAVHKHW